MCDHQTETKRRGNRVVITRRGTTSARTTGDTTPYRRNAHTAGVVSPFADGRHALHHEGAPPAPPPVHTETPARQRRPANRVGPAHWQASARRQASRVGQATRTRDGRTTRPAPGSPWDDVFHDTQERLYDTGRRGRHDTIQRGAQSSPSKPSPLHLGFPLGLRLD